MSLQVARRKGQEGKWVRLKNENCKLRTAYEQQRFEAGMGRLAIGQYLRLFSD
jgi:hypothetical protein